jgi:fucose 4-O-acetylase-like acetyltransferase
MTTLPPIKNTLSQRSTWIDVARVLGAFLIVSLHTETFISRGFDYPSWFHKWAWGGWGCNLFFFLLAGYFTKFSIDYGKQIKRIISLAIPLVLWNLITIHLKIGAGWVTKYTVKSLFGFGGGMSFQLTVLYGFWYLYVYILYWSHYLGY